MSSNDQTFVTVLILVAAVLLVPFFAMALLMPAVGMWGSSHMGDAWMWGGAGWLWGLVWLLVLVGVAGLVMFLFRSARRSDTENDDVALEELRIAYARGDMSDEEFEKRRERLRQE